MNTDAIRECVTEPATIKCVVAAVMEIAAALDVLDERTRPLEQVPAQRAEPTPSTIPGCYCWKCKHAQFVDEGKYWTCGLRGSPAYAVVSVPVGFGCTLGERREAE